MKITSVLCFTSYIMALVFLPSCSTHTTGGQMPGVDIAPDKVNTYFIVFEDPVVKSTNSHKNNEILSVSAKNLSDQTIVFLPGYIHIFARSNHSWLLIENAMTYYPEGTSRLLPPTEVFPPGMDVSVVPYFPGMEKNTKIRVYFVGQLQDSGEKVGAYMDVKLLP